MKGIVFREFLEMVEAKFGYSVVDEIIEKSNIKSKGAYTSVGTYPHDEIFMLVKQLSLILKVPEEKLFYTYGEYVFGSFLKAYPHLTVTYHDAFDLLSHIEGTIHAEVLKLYPDAELPTIETLERTDNKMVMVYRSQRKMSDFAGGLIQASLDYYNEKALVQKEILTEDKSEVLFSITKIYE